MTIDRAAHAEAKQRRVPHAAIAPHEADISASPSRRAREDARLFERYRRTGDQDAREELVERFLPLAKRLAARYRNRP